MNTFAAFCLFVAAVSINTREAWGRSSRSDDPKPLEVVVEQMSHNLQSLQAKYEALNSEVEQLKAENQRRVAFSAFIPESGFIQATAGAVVRFSSEITSVGNAYNKATGVFTCPFDGQYFFAVSIDVSLDYEHLSLRKNGVVVVYADRDDTVSTFVSASTVLSLKQGDVVTVNQDNSVGHLDTGRDCTFTGFLVGR